MPRPKKKAIPLFLTRRLLANSLRDAREEAGFTQAEAARRLFWSLSKLIRIESDTVRATPADTQAALQEYGVSKERLAELVELARRVATHVDSVAPFRHALPEGAALLLSAEFSARSISKYECSVLPGHLQTSDYTIALYKAMGMDATELEARVQLEKERQDAFMASEDTLLRLVIDEEAALRPLGSPQIMSSQLDTVLEWSEHDRVTIQILPRHSGPHRSMGSAFTLLEFKESDVADMVYLEGADYTPIASDDKEIRDQYISRFDEVTRLAASAKATRDILAGIRRKHLNQ